MTCRDAFPLLDAHLDGELEAADDRAVAAHLEGCADCRTEARDRRRLRHALSTLPLPAAASLPAGPARRRRLPAAAVAAATLIAALLFLAVPPAVPELLAAGSRLHDRVLAGAWRPADLGLRPARPGEGDACCCAPAPGIASPFVVYRRGDVAVSLVATEGDPGTLPEDARRIREGRIYHAFRVGLNTVLVIRDGPLTHLWVSRLPEEELLSALLSTVPGRRGLRGERLGLGGVACAACCERIGEGVRDLKGVRVDPVSLDLVLSSEDGPLDPIDLMKAVHRASRR
jgi:hypothetical protein